MPVLDFKQLRQLSPSIHGQRRAGPCGLAAPSKRDCFGDDYGCFCC
jgi:hypothetical protein